MEGFEGLRGDDGGLIRCRPSRAAAIDGGSPGPVESTPYFLRRDDHEVGLLDADPMRLEGMGQRPTERVPEGELRSPPFLEERDDELAVAEMKRQEPEVDPLGIQAEAERQAEVDGDELRQSGFVEVEELPEPVELVDGQILDRPRGLVADREMAGGEPLEAGEAARRGPQGEGSVARPVTPG